MSGDLIEIVHDINRETLGRYNERLKKHGHRTEALGWHDNETQRKRFEYVSGILDFNGKEVLDIGCGFCDFYEYLLSRSIRPSRYLGMDINENFLELCRQKRPECVVELRDLMLKPFEAPVADIGLILGTINYNFPQVDNYKYAAEFIRKSFAACREALVVNIYSSYAHNGTPKNPQRFYYEPERMFAFCQELTPHVSLHHDWHPLPHREMTLVLRRRPK